MYNISLTKINIIFINIIVITYIMFSLLSFVFNNVIMLKITLIAGLVAFIHGCLKIEREYFKIYFFIGVLILFTLVSALVVSRTEPSLALIVNIVASAGIALILLKEKIYNITVLIPFSIMSLFFTRHIINGVLPHEVFDNMSFNGISIVMLVACISLYIVLHKNKQPISLLPAIISLLISIWAMGRSGILSTAFISLGLYLIKPRTQKSYVYILFLCLLLFAKDIVADIFTDFIRINDTYDMVMSKNEILLSGREDIWGHYLHSLNLKSVIFGVDVHKDSYMSWILYNYHNSYIKLHSLVGFAAFIVILLILRSVYWLFKTNKLYFILFLAMSLRMLTDISNYFTVFDFIPFFFIFYSMKRSVSDVSETVSHVSHSQRLRYANTLPD